MRCDEYQRKQYSEVFSDESKNYHTFNSSKIKKVVELFEVHERGKILDIGCGDGDFSKAIAKKTGASLYGIDISRDCIKKARSKGIEAKCVDIDGAILPFEDSLFDAVFCGDTIEHIFDTEKLVSEINRMLKPGGYLVISIPNVTAWYNRVLTLFGYLPVWIEPTSQKYRGTPFVKEGCGHVRAFNKRTLKHFLHDRGFIVEKMKGAPIIASDDFGSVQRVLWNTFDPVFSKLVGGSTFIIAKARKK